MLSRILGIIWMLVGTVWVIKPAMLKNRLTRKMSRRMWFIVMGFIIVFGAVTLGSVFKAPGIVPKIMGLVGLIIAVKAVLFMLSKTSQKVGEWLGGRPLVFFRIWAIFIFLLGATLVFS